MILEKSCTDYPHLSILSLSICLFFFNDENDILNPQFNESRILEICRKFSPLLPKFQFGGEKKKRKSTSHSFLPHLNYKASAVLWERENNSLFLSSDPIRSWKGLYGTSSAHGKALSVVAREGTPALMFNSGPVFCLQGRERERVTAFCKSRRSGLSVARPPMVLSRSQPGSTRDLHAALRVSSHP